MTGERGELYSLLLRLHPLEAGQVAPGAGNHLQAAFLDMVRDANPALSDWLHMPNQRRPYTIGLLQGFNHLKESQIEEMRARQQAVGVMPGQTYWLRLTLLDAIIFASLSQHLIAKSRGLTLRIGDARFEISRLLSMPENDAPARAPSWVGCSSFAELCTTSPAQKHYQFEFATPTAFSLGQKSWGKMLKVFPEPALVFESLARQWEAFAPSAYRLETSGITSRAIAAWCEEHIIVTRYALETNYLSASKFGQAGFQGTVTYEVKGNPSASEAQWLTSLARFALFSGVGYKTTMGMGQTRCTNLLERVSFSAEKEQDV